MHDAIDLSTVTIHNAPADIKDWPITVAIERLELKRPDGITIGAGIPLTWDYHVPGWGNPAAGDDGNVLYTVWAIVKVNGQWHGSGFIQMWKGRPSTGAPILSEWRNWAYARDRWGEMVDYAPQVGDAIGILVSAGSARNEHSVTSVRERSNVVTIQLPATETGVFTFTSQGEATPPPAPSDTWPSSSSSPSFPPENRDRAGTQAAPAPPTDHNPPFVDIAQILAQRHDAVMGECLAIRNQLAAVQQQLTLASQAATDQGKRFEAGLKAVKTIAAQLIAPPPAARKKAGTK